MNPVLGPVTKSRRGSRVEIPAPAKTIRCGIYTRKSTNEGLDGDFTTLDVQRNAAEAFVASQGWDALPDRYDDGGFSGGNLERPALQRLMADIEAGRVDCVVVHKIDRLSRSLLDFVRIAEVFETRNIGLVSVTQQISTTTSAGRLMLNVLFSFAQFEREIIGERTSAAMCALRVKGRWMGGPAILGYSAGRENKKLVVDQSEAAMVRELFDLYLQHRSLIDVCRVVNDRGWTTKTTVYKNGTRKEGVPWNKARLYDVISNVTYIGKVLHKGQLYPGEQDAIIDKRVFREVQKLLKDNSQNGGADTKNKHGALLKGLLKCGNCGAAMTHTYAKRGNRLYRYYMCVTKMKRGKDACPTPTLPAQEIEDFVVEQIRKVAQDPELQRQVFEEASGQQKKLIPKLGAERKRLLKDKQAKNEEIRRLVTVIGSDGESSPAVSVRLAELEGVVSRVEARTARIDADLALLRQSAVGQDDVARTLADFDGVWDVLSPHEQGRIVTLLIESIECGTAERVGIRFRSQSAVESQ